MVAGDLELPLLEHELCSAGSPERSQDRDELSDRRDRQSWPWIAIILLGDMLGTPLEEGLTHERLNPKPLNPVSSLACGGWL
jgi:hypothetical protein